MSQAKTEASLLQFRMLPTQQKTLSFMIPQLRTPVVGYVTVQMKPLSHGHTHCVKRHNRRDASLWKLPSANPYIGRPSPAWWARGNMLENKIESQQPGKHRNK